MDAEYGVTVIMLAWLIAKAEGRHEAAAIRKAARKVRNATKNRSLYDSCTTIVNCDNDADVIESQRFTLNEMYAQGLINEKHS